MKGIDSSFAWCVIAILAALICFDVRSDARRLISARNASLFTVFCWFLLEAIQLPAELEKFQQSEYNYAVGCVLVSLIAFMVGYSTSKGVVFDRFGRRALFLDSSGLLWRLFCIAAMIGMFPLLVLSGFDLWLILSSAFHTGARWSGVFQRGQYGGVRDAFLELQMFLNAAMLLSPVVLFDRRLDTLRRGIGGLFCVWMAARVLLSGARSALMPIVLVLSAVLYCRLSPRRQRAAMWIGVPLFCIVGYLWSAATVATRNAGEFRWSAAADADYVGFEMFRELVFLSSSVPKDMDYQYGMTYIVQFANPIPRFIWSSKPSGDAGLLLARAYGAVDPFTGEPYLTCSPGLIGEMYWNFGMPGVIALSALWGWLARCWDRLPKMTGDSVVGFVIYVSGLALIFVTGRSFSIPALYGMLSFAAMLYVMTRRLPARTLPGPVNIKTC